MYSNLSPEQLVEVNKILPIVEEHLPESFDGSLETMEEAYKLWCFEKQERKKDALMERVKDEKVRKVERVANGDFLSFSTPNWKGFKHPDVAQGKIDLYVGANSEEGISALSVILALRSSKQLAKAEDVLARATAYSFDSTKNRAELQALVYGLEKAAANGIKDIRVIVPSDYTVNPFKKDWLNTWIERGWRNSSNKKIANSDLWQELVEIINDYEISLEIEKESVSRLAELTYASDKMAYKIVNNIRKEM